MQSTKFALLGAAASLVAMAPVAAHAADSAAGARAAPAGRSAAGLQADDKNASVAEIVVTAQRRNESLERTPVAVTALTSTALEQRGAVTLQDVSASTPSLAVTPTTASPNAIMIGMRGALEQSGGAITAESPVAIYIDDVYQSRLQAGNYDLADIVRVEVLRGPQGTLYGRNSMTGAIKLITRQPNGDTWLNTDVSYATFHEVKAKAGFGAPLGEHIAVAASGFYDHRNKGWQYDEVLNRRVGAFTRSGGQLSLAVTNVPNVEAVLTGRVLSGLSDGQYFMPVNGAGQNLASGYYDTRSPRLGYGNTRQQSISLHLGYHMGALTLRSITAYQHLTDAWAIDFSGGFPIPGVGTVPGFFRISNARQHQVSQEFQALGQALDDRLNWIVGAFYFDENATQVFPRDEIGAFFITYAPAQFRVTSTSLAFYGQADYKILPELTASVGLRETHDVKHFNGLAPLAAGLNAPLFASAFQTRASVLTPRFNLQYQINPDAMVYGTVSRGYRAGGFNTLIVADPTFGAPYQPEFAWSYELGAKIQGFDRRAYVNLAAYHEELSNLQEISAVGGVSFAVQNAARARVNGLEWEAGVRPVHGLNLYTSGAYTDDKYLKLDPATTAAQAGATQLPMISRWQYQIGGTYEFDLAGAGSLLLAADYDYRSPYFVQVSYDPISRIATSRRLNGSITYKTPGDHFDVYLQGSNLSNSKNWANALDFFPGFFGLRYPAEPRIIRAGFRYKY